MKILAELPIVDRQLADSTCKNAAGRLNLPTDNCNIIFSDFKE